MLFLYALHPSSPLFGPLDAFGKYQLCNCIYRDYHPTEDKLFHAVVKMVRQSGSFRIERLKVVDKYALSDGHLWCKLMHHYPAFPFISPADLLIVALRK